MVRAANFLVRCTLSVALCVLLGATFSAAGACKRSTPTKSSEPPTVDNPEIDTFTKAPESPPVPKDWSAEKAHRTSEKAEYIEANQVAYDWFANFAFSERDGIPYIALKLLPILAPEIWAGEENFLADVGLFMDERLVGYPLPRGVGFSGLARPASEAKLDYASFTCGACHIGRVALADGSHQYLDGAMNTEFNLAAFRVKSAQTLEKIYDGETDTIKKTAKLVEAFVAAAETMHVRDKNFFYKNYSYNGLNFDADYEAAQVARFMKDAVVVLPLYALRTELELDGYKGLVEKNYPGFESEMLKGMGGMADATGIMTANFYILGKVAKHLHLSDSDPELLLPPRPGLTDFMAVWEQGKRKVRWNKDHTRLMNGGGQWNGNIPIPMYRNMAAQLTLGLIDTDIRISAFAETLLEGLPATVYPFDVDVSLAERGRALFQKNCVECHRPHNGTVYESMGTDMGRAHVVDETTAKSARSFFSKLCSPTTKVNMNGQEETPCAEFEGVSLVDRESLVMSPVGEHLGYNALPLGGIWAQAPYLHTGSVPTLYHLLVVDERPTKFVKSRLDYDQEYVGYNWQLPANGSAPGGLSYVLDTSAFSAVSNKGHDTDIEDDGRVYKLNWSDDPEGAKAIIEYMKTL